MMWHNLADGRPTISSFSLPRTQSMQRRAIHYSSANSISLFKKKKEKKMAHRTHRHIKIAKFLRDTTANDS